MPELLFTVTLREANGHGRYASPMEAKAELLRVALERTACSEDCAELYGRLLLNQAECWARQLGERHVFHGFAPNDWQGRARGEEHAGHMLQLALRQLLENVREALPPREERPREETYEAERDVFPKLDQAELGEAAD